MKIPRARRIGSPIAISTKTHDRVVKVGLALLRLSQNSKTVPKKFEKHHQNTFDENQNAPYRKYGSRFFRQKRAGRVLRQSLPRRPIFRHARIARDKNLPWFNPPHTILNFAISILYPHRACSKARKRNTQRQTIKAELLS